jgi:hypothetical protein
MRIFWNPLAFVRHVISDILKISNAPKKKKGTGYFFQR